MGKNKLRFLLGKKDECSLLYPIILLAPLIDRFYSIWFEFEDFFVGIDLDMVIAVLRHVNIRNLFPGSENEIGKDHAVDRAMADDHDVVVVIV